MAVIKSLDLFFGHLFNGCQPEMSVEEAIHMIKIRREDGQAARAGEVDYIGDRNTVEVDPSKIKCDHCRRDLEISLGRRL
jgi:hypothetical protein